MTRCNRIAVRLTLIAGWVICLIVTAGCKSACQPGSVLKNGSCVSGFAVNMNAGAAAEPSATSNDAGDSSMSSGATSSPRTGSAGGSSAATPTSEAGAMANGTAGSESADFDMNAGGSDAAPEPAGAPAGANEPCAGHGDESFCDDAVLHRCSGGAEAAAPETCMSAMLCQAGAPAGACGACIPGTFQCDGAILNTCTEDAQYELVSECPSVELCKEDAGACLDMQCVPSSVTCSSDGSTLKTCNEDGSAFADEQPCEAGCNATLKACNTCMPNSKACSGNSLETCSADGQTLSMTECMPSGGECATSMCRSNACVPGVQRVGTECSAGKCDATGRCVECITAQDCDEPGPCNTVSCSLGTCRAQPKADGAACGSGMECDGAGACMEKPCGNGRLDSGEACDHMMVSGCTNACKWRNGTYEACSMVGTPCGAARDAGWLCSPNGACTHGCPDGESARCETESGDGVCMPFDGSGNNCAITCAGRGARCPNNLKCGSWGPYWLCGTWELVNGEPMPIPDP